MKQSGGILFLCMSVLTAHTVLAKEIRNYGTYRKIATSNSGVTYTGLRGHVLPIVNTSKKVNPVEDDKTLTFSVALHLNAQDDLEKFLHDLYDPKSPSYRKYLNSAEFKAKYSPTDQQVQQVSQFLKSQGLDVQSVEDNNLLIHATGPVKNINQAFATQIDNYTDPKGKSFFASTFELQVPQGLPIQAVHGLENWAQLRHNHTIRDKAAAAHPGQFTRQTGEVPSPITSPITSPNGTTNNVWWKELIPSAIQNVYNLPTQQTGAGQVLGLVEFDGYTNSDIVAYETEFNLPNVPLQNVLIDGFSGIPSVTEGPLEVTLDIELMIAVAPGVSKIMVYEGPNTAQGTIDTYNRIATDNIAKSISTSWAIAETNATSAALLTENNIFMQMAAQGQTIYAASGDYSAYANTSTLSVYDPASQPYVVGVGGTILSVDYYVNYIKEITWLKFNNANPPVFDLIGGGGGISTIWDIPSYQQGIVSDVSLGSTTMRNVPDVSLHADNIYGYTIYEGGNWLYVGGTSCGAPIWAAFTALVNQQRAANNLSTLGFPNPIFSQIGQSQSSFYNSVFHDIADGTTNGHFPAVPGYDNATGWGSMQGQALLAVLAEEVPIPSPSPTSSTSPIPGCMAPPSVSISPSSQIGLQGQMMTYQVAVTNNDTAGCPISTYSLQFYAPQLEANFSSASLQVSPGQSGSAQLQVGRQSPAEINEVAFTITATNVATGVAGTGTGTVANIYYGPQSTYVLQISPPELVEYFETVEPNVYAGYKALSIPFLLTSPQGPVAGQKVDIVITTDGALSDATYLSNFTTAADGTINFWFSPEFLLHITAGTYRITASTTINGVQVVGTTTFTLAENF